MKPIVAADVMTPYVLKVSRDMSLTEAAHYLHDNQITGCGVTDEDGKLVGVLSMSDVLDSAGSGGESLDGNFYARGWEAEHDAAGPPVHERHDELTVADVMTSELQSVSSDTPVDEIARQLIERRIHRVLVIDDHELLGIITTSDMMVLLADLDDLT